MEYRDVVVSLPAQRLGPSLQALTGQRLTPKQPPEAELPLNLSR